MANESEFETVISEADVESGVIQPARTSNEPNTSTKQVQMAPVGRWGIFSLNFLQQVRIERKRITCSTLTLPRKILRIVWWPHLCLSKVRRYSSTQTRNPTCKCICFLFIVDSWLFVFPSCSPCSWLPEEPNRHISMTSFLPACLPLFSTDSCCAVVLCLCGSWVPWLDLPWVLLLQSPFLPIWFW